jgi:hypothetical protein
LGQRPPESFHIGAITTALSPERHSIALKAPIARLALFISPSIAEKLAIPTATATNGIR